MQFAGFQSNSWTTNFLQQNKYSEKLEFFAVGEIGARKPFGVARRKFNLGMIEKSAAYGAFRLVGYSEKLEFFAVGELLALDQQLMRY